MISNVGMVLRNIYSKKFLGQLKARAGAGYVCSGLRAAVGADPACQPMPAPAPAHPPTQLPTHPPARPQLDGINLFAILSIISIFYCLPAALVLEGFKGGVNNWAPLWDAAVASSGGLAAWAKLLAAGGLFYHLYNQVRPARVAGRARWGGWRLWLAARPRSAARLRPHAHRAPRPLDPPPTLAPCHP